MNDPAWLERPIPENTEVEIVSEIEKHQLLIERFGDWPTFHDAEVMKLTFDRGNTLRIIKTNAWDDRVAESLTVQFYVFDWRYQAESPPYRETLVTVRFEGFERFACDGFSYQNSILGLGITREYSENLKKYLFAVDWGGGGPICHEVSFTCERIVIVSVEPITWPNTSAKWHTPF